MKGWSIGRWVLFLWLTLSWAAPSSAKSPPVVVVLLPGTSLSQWEAADAPHLHQLMAEGALAVMNTRTARMPSGHTRETPESAVLTLGAGARAAGDSTAKLFLVPTALVGSFGVLADDLYVRRTGRQLPPGRSVNVGWPAVLHANAGLGYRLRVGALADALEEHSIALIAGGGLFAGCAASASDGTVRRADKLTASANQCLIWDAGSDVTAADSLIGDAAAQIARLHGRLFIISPFAGDREYAQGHRLTPVLEWGPGLTSGLLRSPSTHRRGLVVNTDFAPTLAAFYGIRRQDFAVRPFGDIWSVAPEPEAVRQTRSLEVQAEAQARGMKLLPYFAVILALWIAGGTALSRLMPLPPYWSIVPLTLLAALLFSSTLLSFTLWLLLFSAMACPLVVWLGARHAGLSLLAVFAGTLILDILTGSHLMQRSLLGYSAVEGARYYGIGNEAMGALIGAMLVLTTRLWHQFRRLRWTLLLLFVAVSLLLGSANAGAKAGGLLVSLAAFGTLAFGLLEKRWTARATWSIALGTAAAMALAAASDAVLGIGAHSHMGEAVHRIQAGGWTEAADIATRKLAVEGRLASRSAWACPLWIGSACLFLIWQRSPPQGPEENALRVAGIVGIAACILLNDAGVIAGALCLVPLWCDSIADAKNRKPLEQQALFQGSMRGKTDY